MRLRLARPGLTPARQCWARSRQWQKVDSWQHILAGGFVSSTLPRHRQVDLIEAARGRVIKRVLVGSCSYPLLCQWFQCTSEGRRVGRHAAGLGLGE